MHPESQFNSVRVPLLSHHLLADPLEDVDQLLVVVPDHGLEVPSPDLAGELVTRAELCLLAVLLQVDGRNQLRDDPLADDSQTADEIQVRVPKEALD